MRAPKVGMRLKVCTRCAATKRSDGEKEAHKRFDWAELHVKAGDGGPGERSEVRQPKKVPNFKYKAGKNQPKYKTLPPAEPADGGSGGSVRFVVDTSLDSLLHLHSRASWNAKAGPSGAAAPNNRAGRPRYRRAPDAPDLRLSVPPGTVVRRKRSGAALADLVQPGQEALVAKGGRGGYGIARARQHTNGSRSRPSGRNRRSRASADSVIDIDSDELNSTTEMELTCGSPGQELSVQLLMRVVADISLVGLPNAGKSSFLRSATRASPDVQPYPFTTLMPQLGVSGPRGQSAILADLPGLIEGAHKGRGLGREFLRHVHRNIASIIVIDAAGANPAGDFRALREELRMYNPNYARRPYVLALNKADMLAWDDGALAHIEQQIHTALAEEHEDFARPRRLVRICAQSGEGVDNVLTEAHSAVADAMSSEDDNRSSDPLFADAPAYDMLKQRAPISDSSADFTAEFDRV